MNLLVTAFLIASVSAAPLVLSSVGHQNAAFDQIVGEKMATYSGAAYCAGQSSVADWSCYACKMVPGLLNITSVTSRVHACVCDCVAVRGSVCVCLCCLCVSVCSLCACGCFVCVRVAVLCVCVWLCICLYHLLLSPVWLSHTVDVVASY